MSIGQSTRSAGQRAGLSRKVVLSKALSITANEGVQGLTVRRLARDLGVMPNAIYSYFVDKDSLLDAVVDSVYSKVLISGLGSMAWEEALQTVLERLRKALVQHAEIATLMLTRPTLGPHSMKVAEFCLQQIGKSSLNPADSVAAFRALTLYTFGFASVQTPRRDSKDLEARSARASEVFAVVPAGEFPELRRHAKHMAKHPKDEHFRRGLAWLIEGIERESRL